VTDASGGVKKRYDYLPFSEEIWAAVDNRSSTTYNAPIMPNPTQDTVNNKFTGKLRDNVTGLDFFGARYFSGAQGRLTSPDPKMLSSQRLYDLSVARTESRGIRAVFRDVTYVDSEGE
jgi:RHS repeat-associated protein